MLLITQSHLLNSFVRALEITYAFIIDPDPYSRFDAFLDSHHPIFVAIKCDDVVGMALHEHLLACVNIPFNQDAPSAVIDLVVFENYVRVVQGRKWEDWGDLGQRSRLHLGRSLGFNFTLWLYFSFALGCLLALHDAMFEI